MNKELLIFGANGALGSGVTSALVSKNFDKIYLFDFKFDENNFNDEKIDKITIEDLAIENNVENAFKNVSPGKNKKFFLYSTIGGFAGGNSVSETSVSEWEKMMSMNLRTSFLLAKHFSGLVSSSDSGSLCFTAAYTGLYAENKKAAYGTSKSALIHLVKSLALEGEEIRLSVNAIAPYIIDTPVNREWMKEGEFSKWMKPEEIGELVNSIFDNYNFVTGNIISLKQRFNK
jgi:NAD(P)-dependent dehydrogenase (short-subunit alcohol dehydrogenase family)